jgi:hypothetical protein
VKAQIGPCYSDYPARLAAIGLTGYLEHQAWRGKSTLLRGRLPKDYLENPAEWDRVETCPRLYAQLARDIVEAIETRLNLVELARYPECAAIEAYRLFAADGRDMRFRAVSEIARAVILYEDVLPAIDGADVHPMTLEIATDVRAVSAPFAKALADDDAAMSWLKIGRAWVRAVCQALAKYVPETEPNEGRDDARRLWNQKLERDSDGEIRLPPLNTPSPPGFGDTEREDAEISDDRRRRRLLFRRERNEEADETEKTPDAAP